MKLEDKYAHGFNLCRRDAATHSSATLISSLAEIASDKNRS